MNDEDESSKLRWKFNMKKKILQQDENSSLRRKCIARMTIVNPNEISQSRLKYYHYNDNSSLRFIIQMRIDHHHNKYSQNQYSHSGWNVKIQMKINPQGDISWD